MEVGRTGAASGRADTPVGTTVEGPDVGDPTAAAGAPGGVDTGVAAGAGRGVGATAAPGGAEFRLRVTALPAEAEAGGGVWD